MHKMHQNAPLQSTLLREKLSFQIPPFSLDRPLTFQNVDTPVVFIQYIIGHWRVLYILYPGSGSYRHFYLGLLVDIVCLK